jgi:hypothetical protein
MRTLQIDRPIPPSLAALYADHQAVDPIAKAALVLTHFEHPVPALLRSPQCLVHRNVAVVYEYWSVNGQHIKGDGDVVDGRMPRVVTGGDDGQAGAVRGS